MGGQLEAQVMDPATGYYQGVTSTSADGETAYRAQPNVVGLMPNSQEKIKELSEADIAKNFSVVISGPIVSPTTWDKDWVLLLKRKAP